MVKLSFPLTLSLYILFVKAKIIQLNKVTAKNSLLKLIKLGKDELSIKKVFKDAWDKHSTLTHEGVN